MYAQTQQEPTITVFLVKGHTNAFIVIISYKELLLFSGIVLEVSDNFLTVSTEVLLVDSDTNFLALDRLLEVGDQAVEGLALHTKLCSFDDDLCDEVSTVIEEVILLHSGMTGSLNCQRTGNTVLILTNGFVNDIFVASLETQVLAAKCLFDELLQPGRGDGVGHNHRTLVVFESDSSSQSNQTVAVDFFAFGIYGTTTVNIGIENHTQISTAGLHGGTNGSHCLGIFGVRDMIREHTVRLKELTAAYISPQRFEHLGGIETADTISGIDYDLEALERMMVVVLVVDLLLDEFTQVARVVTHIGVLDYMTANGRRKLFAVLCIGQHSGNVFAFQTAFTGEEFKTISIKRMVAGSDLNCTVTSQLYGCHKHRRSRAEITIHNKGTCSQQFCLGKGGDMRTGNAGVSADRDFQFGTCLAGFL